MARQRFSAEQIIHKSREADVELAKGTAVRKACRQLNITDKSYDRWRREYGGLKVDRSEGCMSLPIHYTGKSGGYWIPRFCTEVGG